MFTASVYARERLFVKQTYHIVFSCHFLHQFHSELVVVTCNIRRREDWSQLVLSRSNLIVLSLCQNAELPEFFVQVLHESLNARFNHSEVVVFKFLTFRRFRAKQSAAGKNQVLALFPNILVNEEVFLLRTDSSFYGFDSLISLKKMKDSDSLLRDCFH